MIRPVSVASRAATLVGCAVLVCAALSGCGGGSTGGADGADGDIGGQQPPAKTRPPVDGSTRSPAVHRHVPTSVKPPVTQHEGSVEGVALGETLPFGVLDVRASTYRRDGYPAATGTRIDIVKVEECAVRGSARVGHRTWRLIGADGHVLGVAGGKMVNGTPTEDLPEPLAAGACRATNLAIGVPDDAVPIAVQDGPDATWLLPD